MRDEEKKRRKGPGVLRPALGALNGVLAGCAALAVAELVAAGVRPQSGPVVAVGGAAIDRTPTAVKDWAIRRFGTDDKLVLQLGILAVLTLLALALGVLAARYRRTGSAGVLLFGVVGAAAATGRPDSIGVPDALPSAAGAVAGALLLYALTGRLPAAAPPREDTRGTREEDTRGTPDDDGRGVPDDDTPGAGPVAAPAASPSAPERPERPEGTEGPEGWDRRGFVLAATAAAAASAVVGAAGRALNASSGRGAVASRARVVLPRPGSPARPLSPRTGPRISGLSPFVTPNADFYRVDTALVVPKVDAGDWRLRIHGKGVRRPAVLSFDDLLRRELIERDITLTCVSNEVGGPYAGNARWIGVRLADLLTECGVRPPSRGGPADQMVSRSVDGMTIGTPVGDVLDGRDAMLAVGMNGEPLPFAHGFPVRMVVPGLYGYVSACKWLQDIELTTFDSYDPYWVQRGWSQRAPVKTESRIDTPKPFARPKAGTVMVAGVAWAQHRGIDKVEVRIDDGPWQQARLAAEDTRDTWRQWSFPWQATRGSHTLAVRATDRTGRTQTARRAQVVPDGATGWHTVVVNVD
ncbi:molybdopterin-dependent oxidoreductase [Streptomyces sp. NPDC047017]|uniref:molybdopterin-dependent oxidoreductase n=1 Tax=Streptomyces sp. NPDC047017 TaxID=3155024 RepID=UPI0033E6C28D